MPIQIELRADRSRDECPVEIVERKGVGHPDTICDMLSEQLSVALSKYYLNQFGFVLHHNVDKALLAAGRSQPAFGGGRILKPIDLYLSGRATLDVQGNQVPIQELAEEAVSGWVQKHLHAFDAATGIRVYCVVQPGSADLVELFMRQHERGVWLANDTSCGVGFAPLSDLERLVLAVEQSLNSAQFKHRFPETGEDIKVMGLRERECITLTIACAFVGRFLNDMAAYRDAKDQLRAAALEVARRLTPYKVIVHVNAGDNVDSGEVYLTVSGTSAEAGDDGETGRGNRVNGLITPYRPMTLEAMAGKNPITHVGKLYSVTASNIANALIAEIPGAREVECYLLSQIGTPIDKPRVAHVRIKHDARDLSRHIQQNIEVIAEREIQLLPLLWRSFLVGAISVA
jgi:S-adenosylmethionine synthetase